MENRSWSYHLETRDSKYENQRTLISQNKKHFAIPDYFGPWLSGFLEAEGCFRSTHGLNLSLNVGQNDEWSLLNAIKRYFNSRHKLGIHKDARSRSEYIQYRVSLSGKPSIEAIIKHFEENPLLGYKKVSYELFYSKFINKEKSLSCSHTPMIKRF